MANARVTQSVIEAGILSPTNARVTQSVIELGLTLGISCGSPPAGAVGVAYSHTVITGAGTPPYSYSIILGGLPNGLGLNASTGNISGIPSLAGVFTFTIQVTDANLITASVQCSITITGGAQVISICLYGWKLYPEDPCAPDLAESEEAAHVERAV